MTLRPSLPPLCISFYLWSSGGGWGNRAGRAEGAQDRGQSWSRSQTEKEYLSNLLTEQMGRPPRAGEKKGLILGHTRWLRWQIWHRNVAS